MIKSCAKYVLFLVSLRSNLRNTVILQFGDPLCAVAMVFEMMMALLLSCLVHCEASGLMEWRLGSMGSNIARAVVVEGMDPVWIIVVAIFVNGLLIGLLLGTCCFAGWMVYRATTVVTLPCAATKSIQPHAATKSTPKKDFPTKSTSKKDGPASSGNTVIRRNDRGDVILPGEEENLFWRDRHNKPIFIMEGVDAFHRKATCVEYPGLEGRPLVPCGCCKPTVGYESLVTFPLGDKYHKENCRHVGAKGTHPVIRAPCAICVFRELD